MTSATAAWSEMLANSHAGGAYVAAWAAGALVWLVGSTWLAGREGLSRPRVIVLLAVIVPFFFLGARAHAVLLEGQIPVATLLHDPTLLLQPGWRLPGGLLLGALVAPLLAAALGVSFRRFADAALPFAGLSMAVGRTGCLLQGCCHGHVSELPWAMRFPAGSEAWANHVARGLVPSASPYSLPVHPLPLYLIATGVLVTSLLLWLRTRPRFPGEIALLGVVLISWPAAALEVVREQELYAPVPLRSAIPLVVGGAALATWLAGRAGSRRPVTANSA